jgi:DNA polymerase (family X)
MTGGSALPSSLAIATPGPSMSVHNADIAKLFNRLADLLEIEEANPFRVRAYRRAAETIEALPQNLAQLVAAGMDLSELPGIGEDLAGKLKEIVETGRLTLLTEVGARTPESLAALLEIPGLGPKRVHKLHELLSIKSVEDLACAARQHKLKTLAGFGAGAEQKILDFLAKRQAIAPRFKISTAEDFAESLARYMAAKPGIGKVMVAGSYRRRKETVGDLDILVTSEGGKEAIDHFVSYDEVAEIVSKGSTRSTVVLKCGIQVDLRVVPAESFGSALHYFTGSKAHNIAVRKLGQARKLKLNEYGVFKGTRRIAGRTEEDVFASVGLPYIEPELREDQGEIEAAFAGRLPRLITVEDIRGDLHVHTNASDGKSSLRDMARAAMERDYEYLAITDHSKSARIARGLDEKRLAEQFDDIDRLMDEGPGIQILKSSEVDILVDGSLDLSDTILKRLDLVIGAIHSRFDLPAEQQTERVLRAMDNRYFSILAHPTGRLLGERPGYAVDIERVIEGARQRGRFLELNAHPARLDLDDIRCRLAKELGVRIAISTDAHSTIGLDMMRFGIGQARRGWLEPRDVLNALTWPDLKTLLGR